MIIALLRRFCLSVLAIASVVPAAAVAADVGVTVSVNQPGFYGRVEIGNLPPPVLVYPEPVVIQPARYVVERRPVYLHVPPGHAKNWSKHCHRYAACGQPIYFVQQDWYQRVYVPAHPHREVSRGKRARHHEHRHSRHDDDHGRRGKGKHRD